MISVLGNRQGSLFSHIMKFLRQEQTQAVRTLPQRNQSGLCGPGMPNKCNFCSGFCIYVGTFASGLTPSGHHRYPVGLYFPLMMIKLQLMLVSKDVQIGSDTWFIVCTMKQCQLQLLSHWVSIMIHSLNAYRQSINQQKSTKHVQKAPHAGPHNTKRGACVCVWGGFPSYSDTTT